MSKWKLEWGKVITQEGAVVITIGVLGLLFVLLAQLAYEHEVGPLAPLLVPDLKIEFASRMQREKLEEAQHESNRIGALCYTIRSRYDRSAWYVSTKIYGPGIEDGVTAVWLMWGEKDDPGLVSAVDGMAKAFTDVDSAVGPGFGMDKEAKQLRRYVEENVE
jgi:hypothetical protein